jgi:hypothetical protein
MACKPDATNLYTSITNISNGLEPNRIENKVKFNNIKESISWFWSK